MLFREAAEKVLYLGGAVHCQKPQILPVDRGTGKLAGITLLGEKGKGKDGTFPRLGMNPDVSAQTFRNVFGNGKAQSGSAKPAGNPGVGLLEGVEQPPLLLWGDADAIVPHRNLYCKGAIRPGRQPAGLHKNLPPAGSEFDGVGKQVGHHLRQALLVADQHLGDGVVDGDVENVPLLAEVVPHDVGGAHQHLFKVKGGVDQLQLPRFDFGHIQNIVDDPPADEWRPRRFCQCSIPGAWGPARTWQYRSCR